MYELKKLINEINGNSDISELNKIIDQVLIDNDKLIVQNLNLLKKLLKEETDSDFAKERLGVILSNYKRYFDRSSGGSPEVIRGYNLQSKIEDLIEK
jgi:hypothetical protein